MHEGKLYKPCRQLLSKILNQVSVAYSKLSFVKFSTISPISCCLSIDVGYAHDHNHSRNCPANTHLRAINYKIPGLTKSTLSSNDMVTVTLCIDSKPDVEDKFSELHSLLQQKFVHSTTEKLYRVESSMPIILHAQSSTLYLQGQILYFILRVLNPTPKPE